MIVAFEGIDGAGKNTLVTAVEKELLAQEIPVARVSFPRYGVSHPAVLVERALHGELGEVTGSVGAMATLFALDRADVAEELEGLSDDGYVILIDRYIASNAAYSAARRGYPSSEADDTVVWIEQLEVETLGVPAPDLTVLVDVAAEVAADRAERRSEEAAGGSSPRPLDTYEKDGDLQRRTGRAYVHLAQSQWLSPWLVVNFTDADVTECAEQLADGIAATLADSSA